MEKLIIIIKVIFVFIFNYFLQNNLESLRKLFIGGLDRKSSEEDIKEVLSSYGSIVDCVVIRDAVTKNSRGFGFVTFDAVEATDSVLETRRESGGLLIKEKQVEIKRAIPRDVSMPV
ncbi:hypothetical protein BSL78_26501 [Apostichopus japonicus]|uniref:RRM domain-containing protein n=1 Tax=Stichopus japonicus TaxID=307972 RepID=A0A2G8JLP0_STIJA|nr:hypothetical protein BSL78_26501 [Apostichopus japonicus]